MQKINFKTFDGVTIVGNWFSAVKMRGSTLLLHMRPETKESWNDFCVKLNEAGISALAIDLRGHGESTEQNGRKIDYKNFPDGSHAECSQDVDAGLKWLKNQGVSDIFIVGGSIGANLAIDAMARYADIKKGVALSPGLEYLGVSAERQIVKMKDDQKIFLVASRDDEYSYESVKELAKLNKNAEVKLYNDAGHATDMFAKEPKLMDEIIERLRQ